DVLHRRRAAAARDHVPGLRAGIAAAARTAILRSGAQLLAWPPRHLARTAGAATARRSLRPRRAAFQSSQRHAGPGAMAGRETRRPRSRGQRFGAAAGSLRGSVALLE